mgnify:FL=1
MEDNQILARAKAEKRSIVTHDKDFGELAFRQGVAADCGVLLLRLAGITPESDNRRALEAITCSETLLPGNFCVATMDRIRVRPLEQRKA